MDIAHRHNLYVVEDCAHAPGAEYKGGIHDRDRGLGRAKDQAIEMLNPETGACIARGPKVAQPAIAACALEALGKLLAPGA
jgi:hypothetical protein